jgi:solute carrier family 9B (sodium/hydrogen exchanger), member 1/2
MTAWSIPAMLLVGVALGPHGLDVVSPSLLSLLDPGIAMALAMLGALVGLSVDARHLRRMHILAASGIRTLIVVAVVGATALLVLWYWIGDQSPWWIVPLALGACAAVSAPAAEANTDDLLMIVVAGIAIAGVRESGTASLVVLASALLVIAGLVGIAGWMLVGQTDSEGEQHVFVVGSLLLAGGAAAYLALSALLAGLVVGLTWNAAGRIAKARILRDLFYFQHPLVVLVLIIAGAAATLSANALALAAAFVALRVVARPAGSWLAGSMLRGVWRDTSLVAAGLVGIAIALDVFRSATRESLGMMLGAVVAGTMVSSALALLFPTAEGSA